MCQTVYLYLPFTLIPFPLCYHMNTSFFLCCVKSVNVSNFSGGVINAHILTGAEPLARRATIYAHLLTRLISHPRLLVCPRHCSYTYGYSHKKTYSIHIAPNHPEGRLRPDTNPEGVRGQAQSPRNERSEIEVLSPRWVRGGTPRGKGGAPSPNMTA